MSLLIGPAAWDPTFADSPEIVPYSGPKAPWRGRRRPPTSLKPNAMGLVDLGLWPPEPQAPADLDAARFAASLRALCGWMPPKRPARYTEWILEGSKHFGVDPFLLTALIYDQSRCKPRHRDEAGFGLARIHPRMHRNFITSRSYRYWVLEEGRWNPRILAIPKFLFYEPALMRAESNIYFAAALLRISLDQCPKNDGAFGSLRHRHPVSHVVWGDRVRGTDAEDRILTARRRMIRSYLGTKPAARGSFKGLALASPLAGAPRKLTSMMGDDRDGGRRRHKGVDFSSPRGEWVRAVASGRVVTAGADLPGPGGRELAKGESRQWAKRKLGAAGLMVTIRHENGLRSLYMHLDDILVSKGDEVRQGERVGTVGRTGIVSSGAHLHFELRYDGKHVDPLPALGDLAISPLKTFRGIRLHKEARRLRRLRRRQRK